MWQREADASDASQLIISRQMSRELERDEKVYPVCRCMTQICCAVEEMYSRRAHCQHVSPLNRLHVGDISSISWSIIYIHLEY